MEIFIIIISVLLAALACAVLYLLNEYWRLRNHMEAAEKALSKLDKDPDSIYRLYDGEPDITVFKNED